MPFQLEEATIAQLHEAIRSGETTCVKVVEHYLARVRSFNGVASRLVTRDGADVAPVEGAVRAGAPLTFPTRTAPASTLFPDLDKYKGKPLEFGRMQTTASDPFVQQQYGMIVGMPNAGQVNALATLNIRGERSVTCKGDFDRHPSLGALPKGAPPICEYFRHLPDALEQAAALDAQYGRNPDLDKLPMYGVVFSFKDSFDVKDMRSTGGGDAAYDIDFPARDHILIEQLRNKGAIIFAKAVCTEYNGRAGDPGGRHKPEKVLPSTVGYQRSSWGGNPSNPYDTTRSASLGSSSGSALSVSVNFVMASLGEETRASCRGPSNHNAIALILPHKAMLGFDGGAIGADIYCDRSGIHCRSIEDCAKVLDALRNEDGLYYDPRDVYTTAPRSTVLDNYTKHARWSGGRGALKGLRLGIVRDSMVFRPGSKTELPIVDAAAREIKTVLGTHLGAALVESGHRWWTPDPEIERMSVDFRKALARLVPVFMPDIFFRLTPQGEPLFAEFAAAIVPTEFMPSKVFGSGKMQPIDYMVALAEGSIEPPANFDLATIQQQELANTFRFHISQYLTRRAADWRAKGFRETLDTWAALNARSKFWGDDQRAAFKNWEEIADPRNPLNGRQGVNERIMLRELLRRADMMVILENRLDALVRLHTPFPPAIIGGAGQPGLQHNLTLESLSGPNAGLTEVLVPAGYVDTAYDPVFKLSADAMRYEWTPSDNPTKLAAPGLPFSLVFRAEPGKEDVLLQIASAYEAASRRRIPPPAFPPLPARPVDCQAWPDDVGARVSQGGLRMKAAPFEYSRPASVEEACALLVSDENARVIAGGQTLVPMMAMRLARPTRLVDIAHIPDLAFIHDDGESIAIGAATRQCIAEHSALVADKLPLIARAIPWIGHTATRARGTIGGSIANGDPAAELPLMAVTLDATLSYRASGDEGEIAAGEFYIGPTITALPQGALLTGVRFPVWSGRVGIGFHEVSARRSDFAFASAAVQIDLADDGTCARIALGLGGITDMPVRLDEAEEALIDTPLEEGAMRDVLRGALTGIECADDLHASADYRRRAALTLALRAIADAKLDAQGRKHAH